MSHKVIMRGATGSARKEWCCPEHGNFEGAISICPTCKRRGQRVFLTAPSVTRANFSKTNAVMEDAFKGNNLRNYSNATGYGIAGKPTFQNEFQSDSGLVAGYGKDFLAKISGGATLGRLDLEQTLAQRQAVHQQVDPNQLMPDNFAATVQAGAQINSNSHIAARTTIKARDPMEYR